VEVGRVTVDRSFDEWVCRRLAHWPTTRILDFERWLDKHGAVEFLPAVHEALGRRGMQPEEQEVRTSKRLVDELVHRLRRLVRARAQLQVDGAPPWWRSMRTPPEIERLRARLDDALKESAA
jgi:hypothetical protein